MIYLVANGLFLAIIKDEGMYFMASIYKRTFDERGIRRVRHRCDVDEDELITWVSAAIGKQGSWVPELSPTQAASLRGWFGQESRMRTIETLK